VGRANLVPLALAFIAGIIAGNHNFFIVALCAGVVVACAVRGVARVTRTSTVAALALGLFVAHCTLHRALPLSDAHTSRFSGTLIETRALSSNLDTVTVRLADGTLASAALPLPVPDVGARLLMRGRRVAFDDARNPGEPARANWKPNAASRGVSRGRPFLRATDPIRRTRRCGWAGCVRGAPPVCMRNSVSPTQRFSRVHSGASATPYHLETAM